MREVACSSITHCASDGSHQTVVTETNEQRLSKCQQPDTGKSGFAARMNQVLAGDFPRTAPPNASGKWLRGAEVACFKLACTGMAQALTV